MQEASGTVQVLSLWLRIATSAWPVRHTSSARQAGDSCSEVSPRVPELRDHKGRVFECLLDDPPLNAFAIGIRYRPDRQSHVLR